MLSRKIIGLLSLLLILGPRIVLGQIEGPPGFSGAWDPREHWQGWSVDQPYTSEGRALQEQWGPDDDTGLQCHYPLGRILSSMWMLEIFQADGRVILVYEFDNTVRRIYMDGREHEDTFPSLLGRSIGRWEGETLVVETRNLEAGYLRFQGLPYTADMRLTERFSLNEDESQLTVELTFDDPNYYTEPFTVSTVYDRSDYEIRDSACTFREHLPTNPE